MTPHFFRGPKNLASLFLFTLVASVAGADFVPFLPFDGAIQADQVTPAMADSEIAVKGKVSKIEPPAKEGDPFLITISGESKVPPVVLGYATKDRYEIEANHGVPPVGEHVSMKGKLWSWNGMLLIRVKKANEVRLSEHPNTLPAEAVALPRPDGQGYFSPGQLEELKTNFTGSKLAIKGTVSAYRKAWSPTAPNITTLEAEGGKLEVVFWTNEGQQFPTSADKIGQVLYVSGTLKEHKERLQLQVSNNANVSTEPLPPENRAVPALYVETVNPVKKEDSEQ
jgi:DNA/RNA endonuclease YhcR with UshA esterase domain